MTKVYMTPERFDQLVTEMVGKTAELLISKGKEYSQEVNRLDNFSNASEFLGMEPEDYALVLLFKHIQSIKTGIQRGDYDWSYTKKDGSEGFKSRFTDAINYLFLLAAIIEAKGHGKK